MRIFGHCNVCPHSVVRNLNPDFSLSLENSKDLWHSHHLEQISASMLWQMCTLRFSTVCTVLCGLTLACFAHLYGIPAFGAFGLLSLNICSRFLCWGKRTCREVTQCWNRWPRCAGYWENTEALCVPIGASWLRRKVEHFNQKALSDLE